MNSIVRLRLWGSDPQSDDEWPEPKPKLLDDIHEFIGRYVIYPSEHAHVAHTLWLAHTHLMDCWSSTPRLHFKSPEPGSGKTRALEVSELIVAGGLLAIGMSSAYLMRKVAEQPPPTLLYDEIDTVFGPKAKEHEDIRAVINSGHRKGAVSGRCVVYGNKVNTIELPSYSSVALAGIGDLPDTIASRAITVAMKKRTSGETVKPWRSRIDEPQAEKLGERLAEWAFLVRATAFDYWPDMPAGVEDRDADCWEPLVSVADLAGGQWPQRARAAAVALVAERKEGADSLGVLLLTDIRRIFNDGEGIGRSVTGAVAMKTPTLLVELARIEESPWKSIKRDGSRLDARGLAMRLNPYGIKSHDVRWDDGTISKGYYQNELQDAWARYAITDASATDESAATYEGPLTCDVADVADVADFRQSGGKGRNTPDTDELVSSSAK